MSQYHPQLMSPGRGSRGSHASCLLCRSLVPGFNPRRREEEEEEEAGWWRQGEEEERVRRRAEQPRPDSLPVTPLTAL